MWFWFPIFYRFYSFITRLARENLLCAKDSCFSIHFYPPGSILEILASNSSCFFFNSLISAINSPFRLSSSGSSWFLAPPTRWGLDASAISTSLAISSITALTALRRSRKIFRTSWSILACILAEIWGNNVPFVIRPCTMDRWRAAFPVPAHKRKC